MCRVSHVGVVWLVCVILFVWLVMCAGVGPAETAVFVPQFVGAGLWGSFRCDDGYSCGRVTLGRTSLLCASRIGGIGSVRAI